MTTLTVLEHPSASYFGRTVRNASDATLTVAFAVDFTTSGEKLTKQAACTRYHAINLNHTCLMAEVEEIVQTLKSVKQGRERILNIAGNSIKRFTDIGWEQSDVNRKVYTVLKNVARCVVIDGIICGGQTGADMAGAIAGYELGIPVQILMPQGYKQRDRMGQDCNTSKEDVILQVERGVLTLF